MATKKNKYHFENGLVDRMIFQDNEIYQNELKQIFSKTWLFLGHESQIPNAGDYFTTFMGEDPIIVSRNQNGELNAYINSCPHRGMRLSTADFGNTEYFRCPNHGWTFRNDGTLAGVPNFANAYFKELDLKQCGLKSVAMLDTYRGFIFATFSKEIPPLKEFLGNMAWYLDSFAAFSKEGIELIAGVHKWRCKTNWKIIADNHCGDGYHVAHTHVSAFEALSGRKDVSSPAPDNGIGFQINPSPGKGHGLGAYLIPQSEYENYDMGPIYSQELKNYFRSILPEARKALGSVRADRLKIKHGAIFPNFMIIPTLNTIRIVMPKGVHEVEIWSYCYVEKNAPSTIKQEIRTLYLRSFGPSGIFEADDSNSWVESCFASKGYAGRNLSFNYQMGMNHEFQHEELPGMIGLFYSEINQRDFYNTWANYMASD